MSVILVSSCSNRKSIPHVDRLQAADLPRDSIDVVGATWRAWLNDHYSQIPAGELYIGRGAVEAKTAAEVANADHWIISAGLGLVSSKERVPGYDLTVSGSSPNQIKTKITDQPFSPQDWWNQLLRRRRPQNTVARLIQNSDAKLIILAMPTNYLHLIGGDLANIDQNAFNKIRIIGPPKAALPKNLLAHWLPYDTRLDGPESYIQGTRSDFPQRAARHFLETIWPRSKDADHKKHASAVEKALAGLSHPSVPQRKQMNDEEIRSAIQNLWQRAEGKSGKMLRVLRDEELIACEQGRFRKLFNQVKEQINPQQ